MRTSVQASLRAIEEALEAFDRRAALEALRDGISADRVRAALAECNLVASSDVEALYEWRDGTDTIGVGSVDEIHLFPGFYLLSLEDAVADYRAFVGDPGWTRGWLPIFANGGGDFYVIDLRWGRHGAVRHYRIDETEHPIEFASLADMLRTLAAGFDREVFFIDRGGYLEMDDSAFAELAAELNPDVRWWTD